MNRRDKGASDLGKWKSPMQTAQDWDRETRASSRATVRRRSPSAWDAAERAPQRRSPSAWEGDLERGSRRSTGTGFSGPIDVPRRERPTPPPRRPERQQPRSRSDAPQNPQAAPRRAAPDPVEVERNLRKQKQITRKLMRQRRFVRRATALLILIAVLAMAVLATILILFKVKSIQVQDLSGAPVEEIGGYTDNQIVGALDLRLEDNIFAFRIGDQEERIGRRLPLLEQIQVQRVLPNTVVVRAAPATPVYAIKTANGWVRLSAKLKIISLSAENPGLLTLSGGDPVSAIPGEELAFETPPRQDADGVFQPVEDHRAETLREVLAALDARGLTGQVTRIEFEDVDQLAFLYQNRLSVLLGTVNELDYKLDYAAYLLGNKDGKGCAETDSGTIDCSHVRTDGTLQVIFAQGEPTLPSGYRYEETEAPAQVPPAEPTAEGTDGSGVDENDGETPAGAME